MPEVNMKWYLLDNLHLFKLQCLCFRRCFILLSGTFPKLIDKTLTCWGMKDPTAGSVQKNIWRVIAHESNSCLCRGVCTSLAWSLRLFKIDMKRQSKRPKRKRKVVILKRSINIVKSIRASAIWLPLSKAASVADIHKRKSQRERLWHDEGILCPLQELKNWA